MTISASTVASFADALLTGYRSGRRVPVPAIAKAVTRAEAAEIQLGVATALGTSVTGWKVAIPEGVPACAPMFAIAVGGTGSTWPTIDEGYLIEAELAVLLKSDLPPRPVRPYTRDEVMAAVGSVLVGIELIGSRLQNSPPAAPFPAWLADNMGNAVYATGTVIPAAAYRGWDAITWSVSGDGIAPLSGTGHPLGDALAPIVACANAPEDLLGGFRAGQIITTGSLNKPIPWTGPGTITARIEGIGEVSLTIA